MYPARAVDGTHLAFDLSVGDNRSASDRSVHQLCAGVIYGDLRGAYRQFRSAAFRLTVRMTRFLKATKENTCF